MMKSITTFITTALMLFSLTAFSQTKEETVKYINDLYKKTYRYKDGSGNIVKSEKVALDGKTLEVYYSDGTVYRAELMKFKSPIIKYESNGYMMKNSDESDNIFAWISTEGDAKRLKNALEHLIKLVEDEPETDPFAY